MKWDIIADPKAMKRIIKEYCKQLYAHKFNNLEEANQFLKNHRLPRHIQDETNNWNSPTTIKEVEFIIKNFWKTKMQNQMGFIEEIYQTFKYELNITFILHNAFQKHRREGNISQLMLWGQYYPHPKTIYK